MLHNDARRPRGGAPIGALLLIAGVILFLAEVFLAGHNMYVQYSAAVHCKKEQYDEILDNPAQQLEDGRGRNGHDRSCGRGNDQR